MPKQDRVQGKAPLSGTKFSLILGFQKFKHRSPSGNNIYTLLRNASASVKSGFEFGPHLYCD